MEQVYLERLNEASCGCNNNGGRYVQRDVESAVGRLSLQGQKALVGLILSVATGKDEVSKILNEAINGHICKSVGRKKRKSFGFFSRGYKKSIA